MNITSQTAHTRYK